MKYSLFGKILPKRGDSEEKKNLKFSLLTVIGSVVLMLIIAGITFIMALKTPGDVLVPNVMHDENNSSFDIIKAVDKIQEKGLNVKFVFRQSKDFKRGLVIEQRPKGGTLVKQGRHITLVVSQGAVLDSVGDYVGKTLTSVELEIKGMFARPEDAVIKIHKPVMEVYSNEPAGTILEQTPKPGASINEGQIVTLNFRVSKGKETDRIVVPNFLDGSEGVYTYEKQTDFFAALANKNMPLTFKVSEKDGFAGYVLEQFPPAGEQVAENTVVTITIAKPKVPSDKMFGIFTIKRDKYNMKLLQVELRERNKNGVESVIISMKHSGGEINIPYIINKDSQVVFYINGVEQK